MGDSVLRIHLIEDTPEDVRLLRDAFTEVLQIPFTFTDCPRLADGLAHLSRQSFDLVLLDLQLPDSKGIDTLVKVRAQAPQVPIVVLTAADDDKLALQALQHGAQDYLVKAYVQVYRGLLGRSMRYAIERKHAEEALRSAYAQTERLLTALPSILIGVNAQGVITHWNAVAESTFGMPVAQVMNRPLAKCGLQWDPKQILAYLLNPGSRETTSRLDDVPFKRTDGTHGLLGITIVPMRGEGEDGFLICGADVTERQRAEEERLRLQEELSQAQKMEVIGRFAGGIAHDFNNFLQVILGFAWLIRARYQERDTALLSDLQEIVHAAESASGMVRQLLAFSRRQPMQPKHFDINHTIRGMERLLQQLIGDGVQLALKLAGEPLVVKLDPTGLEQILMNLCANARDSMQRKGTLTIRTSVVMLDAAFRENRPWCIKEGEHVQLSIQDTGVGMAPAVAAHIFEPFYTTKKLGRGTGLGLAVVYGLVQQHEGLIHVETAPGQGTTFQLYFALEHVAPDAEPTIPTPEPQAAAPVRHQKNGKPRVLVVDDDPPIRVMCERMLSDRYDVLAVPSGNKALELLREEPYDLLLTDLMMPEMDGFELMDHVSRLSPSLKVLAMTGSLTRETEHRLEAITVLRGGVIRKPFTAAMLLDRIARCLAASPSSRDGAG